MSDVYARKRERDERELASMYNMHNNEHVEQQRRQIEQTKRQAEEQDRETLREHTKEFLEQNRSYGVGIKGRSHPLYRTSNGAYGSKEPSELHKPAQYHGQSGGFTKEFVGGMYRNHSLNTNKTRSTCLKDPSFGTNEWFEPGL